ncbi:MAG TPA: radical SAM family heme chaperone HemW [Tepidisphaeraceae bacterium]|jgi:oxygen-independent coproporphyrinogen-3 oxidase|nr:radical SAM family heme chaperone HemW [Tepidisphaeraceae bacterium]
MPSLEQANPTFDPAALPAAIVTGLYVHIPFCFHKCHYCDFYSITRQDPQRMTRFVDRLLREADLWMDRPPMLRPRTVFFGGGTPTLLPLADMRRLILGLRERFDCSNCVEWTIEANPATVSVEYCRMLVEAGVNRISMGAQSFDSSELALLERHHQPDDVPRGLDIAKSAGIRRLNLDLIYAIPGQTLSAWMNSLERAIGLGTDHLSCYGLTYEPNTPLAVRRRLGQFQSVEPELEIDMLRATRRRLVEAGMSAYEISNYARPGNECQHNLLYWMGEDYLSLGPSAASHVQGWRWRNRPHLGEWENAVDRGVLPSIEVETLAPRQRAGELAMLMLRLSKGITHADFTARTGHDAAELFAEVIDRLTPLGLLDVTSTAIRLSERGLPVADSIMAEFLEAASAS